MNIFSSREVATFIWLVVLTIFVLTYKKVGPDILKGLKSIVSIIFSSRLLIVFGSLLLYLLLCIKALHFIGAWDIRLLKDTVIWFFFGAISLFSYAVQTKDTKGFVKNILVRSIQFTILVEYLITTYTFPLWVELALFPILVVLVLMEVLTKSNDKLVVVSKISNFCIAIIGLYFLYAGIKGAMYDLENLLSVTTIKNIVLVPTLTIMLLPYLFFFSIYSLYENIFNYQRMGQSKPRKFEWYVKWRIFTFTKLNREKLIKFHETQAKNLTWVKTHEELDNLFVT